MTPDGPRYNEDFYAWTQHQAALLRSMEVADNRFDRQHVAEEIEDLGKRRTRCGPQAAPSHHRAPPQARLFAGPGAAV